LYAEIVNKYREIGFGLYKIQPNTEDEKASKVIQVMKIFNHSKTNVYNIYLY